jgi:hypothetical protein
MGCLSNRIFLQFTTETGNILAAKRKAVNVPKVLTKSAADRKPIKHEHRTQVKLWVIRSEVEAATQAFIPNEHFSYDALSNTCRRHGTDDVSLELSING